MPLFTKSAKSQPLPCGRCEQMTGKKIHNIFKNVNILEFHDHIWNHHEKCIQKSTNMPGINSLICEIDVKISEI